MRELAPGDRLGAFEVLGLLGSGRRSAIYAARHASLGTLVALRVFGPDPDDVAWFRRHRSMYAARRTVPHPGLVRVLAVGEADGFGCVALTLVRGPDVASVMARRRLPLGLVAEIVAIAAEGLDALHRAGLAHGDVRAANLVFDGDPSTRSTPILLADPDPRATGAGSTGSPESLAPERIGGTAPSSAADVYALGCLLFHCLAGRPPFGGESEAEALHGHLVSPPPRLAEAGVDGGWTARVDQVVARAMAKYPRDRYPSGAALAREAVAALAEAARGAAAGTGSDPGSAPDRAPAAGVPVGSADASAAAVDDDLGGEPTAAHDVLVAPGPADHAGAPGGDDRGGDGGGQVGGGDLDPPDLTGPAGDPAPPPEAAGTGDDGRPDLARWDLEAERPGTSPAAVPAMAEFPATAAPDEAAGAARDEDDQAPATAPPPPVPAAAPGEARTGETRTGEARPADDRTGGAQPADDRPRQDWLGDAPAEEASPAPIPPAAPAAASLSWSAEPPPGADHLTALLGQVSVLPTRAGGGAAEMADFAVFAPSEAARGTRFEVEVLLRATDDVALLRALAAPGAVDGGPDVRTLAVGVDPGDPLHVDLWMGALEVENPTVRLAWDGGAQVARFPVGVPAECPPGTVAARVGVSRATVPVGHVDFHLRVTSAGAAARTTPVVPTGHDAVRYRRAHLVFADGDRDAVRHRAHLVRGAGLATTPALDGDGPGAGPVGPGAAEAAVDEADVVLLFWSARAASSEDVYRQVSYALSRHRRLAVRPVLLDGPPAPPPWPELAGGGFGEHLRFLLSGGG